LKHLPRCAPAESSVMITYIVQLRYTDAQLI
jgi:hypothetical protein